MLMKHYVVNQKLLNNKHETTYSSFFMKIDKDDKVTRRREIYLEYQNHLSVTAEHV